MSFLFGASAESKSQIADLEAEVAGLVADLEAKSKLLETRETELATAVSRGDAYKKRAEKLKTEAGRKIKELETEVVRQQRVIEITTEENREMEIDLDAKADQAEDFARVTSQNGRRIEQLENELSDARLCIDGLEARLAEATSIASKFARDAQDARVQLSLIKTGTFLPQHAAIEDVRLAELYKRKKGDEDGDERKKRSKQI